jgi:hypothetical protein
MEIVEFQLPVSGSVDKPALAVDVDVNRQSPRQIIGPVCGGRTSQVILYVLYVLHQVWTDRTSPLAAEAA